jgi:acyl carrier protein phosphodiesterase
MNYLAHLVLSGDSHELMVGNFIGDFVKGKDYKNYKNGVRDGILLHRKIDYFTDNNSVTKDLLGFLRSDLGKFSGVFIDMMYDHFLAVNIESIKNKSLLDFSTESFSVLDDYLDVFPEKLKFMYIYMKRDNWLYRYKEVDGIQKSLEGLSRRFKFDNNLHLGGEILKSNYDYFEKAFFSFYPHIESYCQNIIIDFEGGRDMK